MSAGMNREQLLALAAGNAEVAAKSIRQGKYEKACGRLWEGGDSAKRRPAVRPREPHDWTERAIAADPAQEAFYRHHLWFCLWIGQGREWSAARGKLERQAIARVIGATEEWTRATDRLTTQTAKAAEAFEAFGEAMTRLKAEDTAHLRRQHAEWFVPWVEHGRALAREASA